MIDFKNGGLIKLSKTSPDAAKDILPLLISGEDVIGVYKTVRDHVVFTTKRVICVNVQGLTGRKKDYTSLPYSKIQTFSIETAGVFDMDSELEMWFSGLGLVKLEFTGASDIVKIGQLISSAIL
jgi:hypothetical protein